MELKIRKSDENYIIDVNGEMDLYNSYRLKELVMKMLEKKVERFIINLENVDYIDSSGIGALIYICSTIKKMNLKLIISNIHGSVKKVIELTKLMGYFPIANSIGTSRETVTRLMTVANEKKYLDQMYLYFTSQGFVLTNPEDRGLDDMPPLPPVEIEDGQ